MSYFHPWTLRVKDADAHVPYAGSLRAVEETWQEALRSWLDGLILCEEAKRYVSNFMVVTRARPEGEEDDVGNSDDLLRNEKLDLRTEDLAQALDSRNPRRWQEA